MLGVIVLIAAFSSGLAAGEGKVGVSVVCGVVAAGFVVAWEWTVGNHVE
jgi:hypothetical protein